MKYCEEKTINGETKTFCIRWDQCFWCQRYQSGQAKPNYPMPATMEAALWSVWHDEVAHAHAFDEWAGFSFDE